MKIDKNFVDNLLKPLGFVSNSYKSFMGEDICIVLRFKMMTLVYLENYWDISNFDSYETLWTGLTKCSYFTRSDNNIRIQNPYYGCRSIEEAMILKDLIA